MSAKTEAKAQSENSSSSSDSETSHKTEKFSTAIPQKEN